jgi:hypothetical protein
MRSLLLGSTIAIFIVGCSFVAVTVAADKSCVTTQCSKDFSIDGGTNDEPWVYKREGKVSY